MKQGDGRIAKGPFLPTKGRSESKGLDYTSGRCIDARSRSPFLDLLKRPSRSPPPPPSPFNSLPAVQVYFAMPFEAHRPAIAADQSATVTFPRLLSRTRSTRCTVRVCHREPLPGLTWKTSRYKALPGPWFDGTSGGPSIPSSFADRLSTS